VIEFKSFDAVTLRIGQSIEIGTWKFNQPSEGVGQFEGEMRPHPRYRGEFIPDKHGIAVVDDGQVVWAGFLRKRPWRARATSIAIMAEDLGSFFYDRVRAPGHGDYLRENTEQRTMWDELIKKALLAPPATGIPTFSTVLPAQDTGVLRQLTFRKFKTYGAAFDNLSRRDRGLQWWVSASLSEDGRFLQPVINVGKRGRLPAGERIRAESNREGGNLVDYSIPEASDVARTAVYATGEGQPPDVPWSYDEDPRLARGQVLRREVVVNFSGVVKRPTLTRHAQEERKYRSAMTSEIELWLPADKPDYRTYDVGDRVRVEIEDPWVVNYFLPASRIVDREVGGTRGDVRQVHLTLDTNDYDAPGDDVGTEVG
jgi:hypothetical protein